MGVKLFGSILSADFANIEKELKRMEGAGLDGIHIDIMDGHFVKNFSMGDRMVAAIRRNTSLFLDVHLMIYNPYDYIERFISAGADKITIHFEATEDIGDTLSYIGSCGKKRGLAFNPETSHTFAEKYFGSADSLLFMSVDPGFGGQSFKKEALFKIMDTKEMLSKVSGKAPEIEVDGGIDVKSAQECIKAGADVVVSGSYLFSGDMKKRAKELRG